MEFDDNKFQGFCVIADCHIDLRGFRPEIPEYDTLFPLVQAVDYCLENQKPLVIAGDLFDKSLPQSRLLAKVTEEIERLTRKGIPVWGIQGNHDKDPQFPWFGHAKGSRRLSLAPEVVGGYRLCGIDFNPAATISQQLTQVPKCDGLVLHQALKQGLGFDHSWNCDLDWVDQTKVRDVWIGDLHRVYQELWSSDGAVRALYTGSQYMVAIDESPNPSFLEILPKTDPGTPHAPYRRVQMLHRPVLQFTLESEGDLQRALQEAQEAIRSPDPRLPPVARAPIIIARYYADIPSVSDGFRELCRGGLAFYAEQVMPAREHGIRHVGKLGIKAEEGLTMAALVGRRVSAERDPSLHGFLGDLVRAQGLDEAKGVIQTWKNKIYSTAKEP